MLGTNRHNGQQLAGIEHLKQSLADILNTRKGTRVLRREYGSNLPNLIDRPVIPDEIKIDLYAETAEAIALWEPRFRLQQVELSLQGAGVISMSLTGKYLPDGREITLAGIIVK